jgi:phytoene/squalene synthetase
MAKDWHTYPARFDDEAWRTSDERTEHQRWLGARIYTPANRKLQQEMAAEREAFYAFSAARRAYWRQEALGGPLEDGSVPAKPRIVLRY